MTYRLGRDIMGVESRTFQPSPTPSLCAMTMRAISRSSVTGHDFLFYGAALRISETCVAEDSISNSWSRRSASQCDAKVARHRAVGEVSLNYTPLSSISSMSLDYFSMFSSFVDCVNSCGE